MSLERAGPTRLPEGRPDARRVAATLPASIASRRPSLWWNAAFSVRSDVPDTSDRTTVFDVSRGVSSAIRRRSLFQSLPFWGGIPAADSNYLNHWRKAVRLAGRLAAGFCGLAFPTTRWPRGKTG